MLYFTKQSITMEDKTMGKILLSVILLTCVTTGILHSDYKKQETMENILAEQTYMMPDLIIDPSFDPVPY